MTENKSDEMKNNNAEGDELQNEKEEPNNDDEVNAKEMESKENN